MYFFPLLTDHRSVSRPNVFVRRVGCHDFNRLTEVVGIEDKRPPMHFHHPPRTQRERGLAFKKDGGTAIELDCQLTVSNLVWPRQ